MNKSRPNTLMPNGIPKWLRCYDNEGKSIDRFTVVFTHSHSFGMKGLSPYLGMSSDPSSPQGFGQHMTSSQPIDRPTYGHLGKKIAFQTLPAACQAMVIDDYKSYWKLQ